MECKQCGSVSIVKSGFARGVQRYKCRDCGKHFIVGDRRTRYDGRTRLAAIRLYLEGVGFRGIERLLKISNVTAMRWIGQAGEEVRRAVLAEPPPALDQMEFVVSDEMWHYIQKNSKNYGYGLLFLPSPGRSLPSKWVLVGPGRSKE